MQTDFWIVLIILTIVDVVAYLLMPYDVPFGSVFQVTMIIDGVGMLILGYYALDHFFGEEDEDEFEKLEERVSALEEREKKRQH